MKIGRYAVFSTFSGNRHETCGSDTSVVVLKTGAFFSYSKYRTKKMNVPSIDFFYDSCVQLNTSHQSSVLSFELKGDVDTHPRHCLELCSKYERPKALLSSKKCLCLNTSQYLDSEVKQHVDSVKCSQECRGNYFYSCGNENDSTIYSAYLLRKSCPPGKYKVNALDA